MGHDHATGLDGSKTGRVDVHVALRPAHSGDVNAMCDIHHRCWLTAFTRLVEPAAGVTDFAPDRNRPRFTDWVDPDSDASVVVAEVAGDVAGYATVVGRELLHLFVDPDLAGRGIGRHLLADAERRIADGGHAVAELHTMFGNEPAIGLYLSAGWEMTDGVVHTDSDHGVSYDEHVLVKRLVE